MRVPDKRDLGDKSAHRDLILLFHEMSQFMRENKEHSHSANMRGGRTQCMVAWLAKLAKNGYFKFAQIPTVGEKDGTEIHILCDVYFNIRREDKNNREPMLKLGWKEKILILTAGWK
jgi:hypothetical protein